MYGAFDGNVLLAYSPDPKAFEDFKIFGYTVRELTLAELQKLAMERLTTSAEINRAIADAY